MKQSGDGETLEHFKRSGMRRSRTRSRKQWIGTRCTSTKGIALQHILLDAVTDLAKGPEKRYAKFRLAQMQFC